MAIYHLSLKIIKRSAAKSAVGSAAYRAGEKLVNEWDGLTHDYTRKQGVIHKEIMLPAHAPKEFLDRSTLWNSVEMIEKNKKAQLAREVEIALPVELSLEENITLAREYARKNFIEHGMCADVCVHDTGTGNPHAHILLTMRPIREDGIWGDKQKKEYLLNADGEKIYDKKKRQYKCRTVKTTDWDEPTKCEEWRQAWTEEVNAFFMRKNLNVRIDNRSYKEQGLEIIPTIHMGTAACQMERNGIKTEKGDINRDIKEKNLLIKIWNHGIALFKTQLNKCFANKTELETEISTLENAPPEPKALDNLITKLLCFHENGGEFTQAYSPYVRHLKGINGLKNIQKAVSFLQATKIETIEQLQAKLTANRQKREDILTATASMRTRIDELDKLLENYGIYKEHKPIIVEYEEIKSERKKNKFFDKYNYVITTGKSARKELPEKLTPKAWTKERDTLMKELPAELERMARIENSVAIMETIKRNAENLDRAERGQERERTKQKTSEQEL